MHIINSDKRPFCFKMAEELIWGILRENNVELSKDTLNFYLKKVLEDHKDLYNSMSVRIGRNNVLPNLVSIYQDIVYSYNHIIHRSIKARDQRKSG